ncbi:MAG: neuromedin U [Synechococcaceae cyanobacterium]|nr:neuromedin U [Synechococcaceae cyanobacterium]
MAPLVMTPVEAKTEPEPERELAEESLQEEKEETTGSLAASSQNPIADLISVPFQNNTTFGIDRPGLFDVSNGGLEDVLNFDTEKLEEIRQSIDPARRRRLRDELRDLRDDLRNYEDETLNVLNIQPVIPIRLSKDLTLVTRTIVPVVSKPTLRRGQIWGLGDINPTFFFVPRSLGAWTFGAGPSFLLPTATDQVLGTGKWSAGPAAVAVYTRGPWVAGALVSQIWSFAGDSQRGEVSSFLAQPFLNDNLPGGWYLTSSPILTANWQRDRDPWTIPLGGGFGRIFSLGGQPMSLALEGYGNVAGPPQAGDFTARLTFKLLFPTKGS